MRKVRGRFHENITKVDLSVLSGFHEKQVKISPLWAKA